MTDHCGAVMPSHAHPEHTHQCELADHSDDGHVCRACGLWFWLGIGGNKRGDRPQEWENRARPQGALTPAASDHLPELAERG